MGGIVHVPWYAFINAVEHDFDWAGQHLSDQPLYAVLNAVRTLHATTQRTIEVVSKEEAAHLARPQLPIELRAILDEALAVREGSRTGISPERVARIGALRAHVLDRAHNAFERARDDDDEAELVP